MYICLVKKWFRYLGFNRSSKNASSIQEEEEKDEPVTHLLDRFEKAYPYLAVRIYPAEIIHAFQEEDLIVRYDIEGLPSILVLDLPDSVECVLRSDIASWEKSDEELFEIGLKNLREKYKREWERGPHHFLQITENDNFVTTEALLLERNKACMGAFGCIFSLPERDLLLCAPISSDIDLEVCLQRMIPLCNELYDAAGELKLSDQIFWHYQNQNQKLYTIYSTGRLKYVLPQELEELVYG